MNCDQVFDVLTRGPFPTGTDCDEPVELHLTQCPECHRLAEALRPALELFQEAVDPEESRDLPGYWSAVANDQQAVLSYAAEVESRHAVRPAVGEEPESRAGKWSTLTAWRMAAMLAVGVTLGMFLGMRSALDVWNWSPAGSGTTPASLAAPPIQPPGDLADRLQLAALPAACRRGASDTDRHHVQRGDLMPLDGELARLECCSGCHHAQAAASVPAAATLTVAASCQLCHNQRRMTQFEVR